MLFASMDKLFTSEDIQTSLSHSIVFLYFSVLITEAFLSLLAILSNSAFKWVYLSFSPLPFLAKQ